MTDWVRLWHDMPTDPKWRTIARKSGQRVGDVIAVFNFIIVNASANAADRGTLAGFDVEDVASALDIDEQDVNAIVCAMQGKVLDGERLSGWEKRQPKREDSTAAERKAAWKERQRSATERSGTQGNAPESESESETDSRIQGRAAVASPVVQQDELDLGKQAWTRGVEILTAAGTSQANARSMLGRIAHTHGNERLAEVIDELVALPDKPADPKSWIAARLPVKPLSKRQKLLRQIAHRVQPGLKGSALLNWSESVIAFMAGVDDDLFDYALDRALEEPFGFLSDVQKFLHETAYAERRARREAEKYKPPPKPPKPPAPPISPEDREAVTQMVSDLAKQMRARSA